MADSGTDDREERGERYSDRVSAPPPEFDDGPAGETRQTPKDELARWRRMAARGNDRTVGEPIGPNTPLEPGHDPASVTVPALDAHLLGDYDVTRAVQNPLAPNSERPGAPMPWSPRAPEPPTRELQLSSDMVALSRPDARPDARPEARRDATGSIPPRAPPPRPALRPLATSVPPELPFVPNAPPLGVSALSLPSHSLAPAASAGMSRWMAPVIAIVVVGLACGIAVAVVLWPDTGDPLANPSTPTPAPAASAPANPSTSIAVTPANPSTPVAEAPPNPSTSAIAPNSGVDVNPSTPEALVETGDIAFEAREYGRALAAYQAAIALNAHEAHAFEGAARTCIALSRGEDAVRFAERAVAHRQRRASYRVLLGDAHQLAGHLDEAQAAWRYALTLDPDDAAARARLE